MEKQQIDQLRGNLDEILRAVRLCKAVIKGIGVYRNTPDGLEFSTRKLKTTADELLHHAEQFDRLAGDLYETCGPVEEVEDVSTAYSA